MIDHLGPVPLQDAADLLGVPKAQIARWCADGTLVRGEHFEGWAGAPSRIRLTGDGLQKLREGLPKAD